MIMAVSSEETNPAEEKSISTSGTLYRIAALLVLGLFSGLFSGLTLGLMGLDKIGLEIVIGAGEEEHASEEEKKQSNYASIIYPVRKDGNLLLTTLLLGNVSVNALFSILLADLTSGTLAFLVSTGVIVLFGEILPQALCSRHALYIGSRAIPVVKVIIWVLFILAKPISVVLDRMLGEEIGTVHTKREVFKYVYDDIHLFTRNLKNYSSS